MIGVEGGEIDEDVGDTVGAVDDGDDVVDGVIKVLGFVNVVAVDENAEGLLLLPLSDEDVADKLYKSSELLRIPVRLFAFSNTLRTRLLTPKRDSDLRLDVVVVPSALLSVMILARFDQLS